MPIVFCEKEPRMRIDRSDSCETEIHGAMAKRATARIDLLTARRVSLVWRSFFQKPYQQHGL